MYTPNNYPVLRSLAIRIFLVNLVKIYLYWHWKHTQNMMKVEDKKYLTGL